MSRPFPTVVVSPCRKWLKGGFRMNKEADLENVPRESIAPSLPLCLLCVVPLTGILFALACGTPPRPAVPAGELLLLNDKGQSVNVGEPLWEDALYYHEENNATPYTGPIEAAYTNGNKRMLAFVRKGRLDGSSIIWFENGGQEQLNIVYKSGAIGAFKEYDENGTLLVEYPEPTLTPVGPTNVVSTNTPPTSSGTNDVRMSLLELRGAQIYHVDEMIFPFTGTAIEQWQAGSIKKRETFLDGEHHGSVKWWHKNGKPWYNATYKNGLPEGKVEAWRPDATREYIYTWVDGFPSSKVTYAPDDTESGRVTNDAGTLIYFHPNGKKKLEEVYEGNILAPARQIWYDENGIQIDPTLNPSVIPSPNN